MHASILSCRNGTKSHPVWSLLGAEECFADQPDAQDDCKLLGILGLPSVGVAFECNRESWILSARQLCPRQHALCTGVLLGDTCLQVLEMKARQQKPSLQSINPGFKPRPIYSP